jgi:hypothetical protein
MANRFWVGATATWDATAGTKWATTSGGAGGAATPTAADDVFFDGASGVGTVTCSVGVCRNIDFTGFAGTFAGAGGVTVSGSFKWAATMTRTHTGPFAFNATSGVQPITSNGVAFGGAVTFNGAGGTWQLQDALSAPGATVTLTSGSLDTNSKNLSCGSFAGSGAVVRSLTMTNSTLTVTGNWSFSTVTNLTFSASGSTLIFAGAAGQTFTSGGLTYGDVVFAGSGAATMSVAGAPTVRDFKVQSGTTFTCTTTLTITRDYIFTGFAGAWTGSSSTFIGRHFTLAAGMTASATTTLFFNATTGPNNVTTNGVTLLTALQFIGVGGSWVLQDALTTTKRITLTDGSLSTNGKAVACASLYAISSSVRALDITNTTLTLNALNITVFDLTGANLTFSSAGSVIKVDNTGSPIGQTQDFNHAGQTYNVLQFVGTGAGGFSFHSSPAGATFSTFANTSNGLTMSILGDNTFGSFSNPPRTLTLAAGITLTIGVLTMTGSAGNPLTIRTTIPGTSARLVVPKNNVAGDYIDVQDCVATGGARWYAGKHGTNSGGNNGWRFTDPAPRPQVVRFAA